MRTLSGTKQRSLLSRLRAFEMRGVTLRDPSLSWGGVRCDDGAVVLALWAGDILADDQGCSCLLWAPAIARGWTDGVSRQERLDHCRLAVLHGGAEGLLVCGDAALVDPDIILALRVVKLGDEYWAKWGSAVRTLGTRAFEKTPKRSPQRFDDRRIAA